MRNEKSISAEKLLLTPKDVIGALSLSRAKVYQLLKARVIPSIKIGRSVRIPVEALREWINLQLTADEGE
jgi:excisionase family DNA binding protein